MKNWIYAVVLLAVTACTPKESEKIKVYGWEGEGAKTTEQTLEKSFSNLQSKGLHGICYNAGHSIEKHQRAARIAKANGLEYQAWIPAMLHGGVDSTLYAVNRKGESAYNVQAYVSYYKFMCPNREEVYDVLANIYGPVADIPEVDAIHLDYIRFVDVILARGLWEKYDLVMNEEYPTADYCYCDKCVADFKALSGVDIRTVADPSKNEAWKQFRCDVITKLVNRLADMVHAKGKKLTAAVFPGPSAAKKMVRQEWDKWNLDAVFPMNYNDFYLEGPEWLGPIVKEEVTAVDGRMPVYSGLFICPNPAGKAAQKDPEGHGLIPEELAEAVQLSMDNGASGISLFTPSRMTDEGWKIFDKVINKK